MEVINKTYNYQICFISVFIILIVYVMMARTLYAKKPPLDPDIIEGSVSHQQVFTLFTSKADQ